MNDMSKRIHTASATEFDKVSALMSTEYDGHWVEESFWKWRYFDNPVADVAVVVGRDDEGAIIAMQTVSAYPFLLAGRRVKLHLFTTGIVHPDHRRKGWFQALISHINETLRQRGNDFFTYTFPNDLSQKAFTRFPGWYRVDDPPLWARPVSPLGSLRRRLLMQRAPSLTTGPAQRLSGQRFEWIDDFSGFRAFRPRGLLADKLLIERSADYMSWRYGTNPIAEYAVCAAYGGEGLDGYIAVTDNSIFGTDALFVVDLVAPDVETSRRLIGQALHLAQSRQYDMIGGMVGSMNPFEPAWREMGFLPVRGRLSPKQFHLMGYPEPAAAPGNPLGMAVSNTPWYVVWADTDVV